MIPKLEAAREHLKRARDKLESARSWSIGDIILGGGLSFIADIFEYSEFKEAKREVQSAAKLLRDVRQHLKEMEIQAPEINHTLSWAIFDIGFDGIFIDLLRHFKIKEAKEKVEEGMRGIDQLIFKLKQK